MIAGRPLALIQFLLILLAYSALTVAFIRSDFSLSLVVNNSHTAKPLIYKISGVWGNHEGSMLLWVLVLSFYGALLALFGKGIPEQLKSLILSIQSAIALAFLSFVLFTSNPFDRTFPPPFNGNDLNPLLQDPGLAFHPPLLYMGYVGLSITYSFALAALISGKVGAAWAHYLRPWALLSWICLTLGIALGSWWAYYELGWGGWWFWDPVENASFMPWLVATALLHSALVVEKRECLASWTVLLAIMAFSLSLLGTFIVRSGIITSVHAFASDPTRGIFILCILGFFAGGALLLYGLRSTTITPSGVFALISRETAILFNNIILVVATFVVLVGTFWPLIAELVFERTLSVGAPYFNSVFTPFAVTLALALPIGSMLAWKRGSVGKTSLKLKYSALFAMGLAVIIWIVQPGTSIFGPAGIALGTWLILGALADFFLKIRVGKISLIQSVRWLIQLPGTDWGKMFAHAGLGLTIMGISAITAWEQEDIRIAYPHQEFKVGGYSVMYEGVRTVNGPNYVSDMGDILLSKDGQELNQLHPEIRYYPAAGSRTTEAAIDTNLLRDIYIVIGNTHEDNGRTVRTYIKPLAIWIWLGAAVMFVGGIISIISRRIKPEPEFQRATK